MADNNLYAFPSPYIDRDGDACHHRGLSKREYIATQLLAGMLSDFSAAQHGIHAPGMIRASVQMADQLLNELNK